MSWRKKYPQKNKRSTLSSKFKLNLNLNPLKVKNYILNLIESEEAKTREKEPHLFIPFHLKISLLVTQSVSSCSHRWQIAQIELDQRKIFSSSAFASFESTESFIFHFATVNHGLVNDGCSTLCHISRINSIAS